MGNFKVYTTFYKIVSNFVSKRFSVGYQQYYYVNYYSLFQPLIDLSSTTEINQFIKQSNVSAFTPRPSSGIIQDKNACA